MCIFCNGICCAIKKQMAMHVIIIIIVCVCKIILALEMVGNVFSFEKKDLTAHQGLVPQSDLSSTIIVSRFYNDLNVFLQMRACSTKIPYLTVIIG